MDSSVDEGKSGEGTDIQLSIGDLMLYEEMTDEQRQRVPDWLRTKADAELDRMKRDSVAHIRMPDTPESRAMTARVSPMQRLIRALRDTPEKLPRFGHASFTEEDIRALRLSKEAELEAWADEANRRTAKHIRHLREAFADRRRVVNRRHHPNGGKPHGFNRADAAWMLGMSESRYRDLERGEKSITVGEAAAIATFYAVPEEVLVSPLDGEALEAEADLLRAFYSLPEEGRRKWVDAIVTLTNLTQKPS